MPWGSLEWCVKRIIGLNPWKPYAVAISNLMDSCPERAPTKPVKRVKRVFA
jgi:hypothetical protein